MAKLLDSPFWELLAKKQQSALTEQLILSLSSQLEAYGYRIVPVDHRPSKSTRSTAVIKKSNKRGRRGEPVVHRGVTYESLAQACEKLGISYSTAAVRRKKGQPVAEVLDALLAKKSKQVGKRRVDAVNAESAESAPKVLRRSVAEQRELRYPMAAKLQAVRQIRGS